MKKLLLTFSFCLFLLNAFSQVANQPSDLSVCDSDNDGFAEFDLTYLYTQIIGSQDPTGFVLTYHETLMDADSGTNAIVSSSNYTNTSNPQTIYVRLEEASSGNYDTTSFDIIVEQTPAAITPTPFQVCDDNNDGFAEFDLSLKDNEITGGAPGLTVTYHETFANAENNVDAIDTSNLYSNIAPSTQTLYARVEGNGSNCSTIVELELIVNTGVQANPDLQPIVYQQCDDNAETDGDPSNDSSQFDLSVLDFQILDGQSPSLYTLSYFATLMDAESGVNPLPTLYQNTTNPQVIYARVENYSGCYDIAEATLTVTPIPYLSVEDTILCVDESVTIDTGLSSEDYAFLWYVDGFIISGESLPTLTINSPGVYTVQVIDLQGCGSVITEFLVTELPCPDADSDGVDDSEEDINNNGNLDDDDTDGDGIPNYLDDDDDGDGVPTEDEIAELSGRNSSSTHPFVDTDNDMIENYLDDDDDGDGVLTIDEDYNNNGDPTDDDTNSNMIPDYLEADVALNVESLDKLSFKLYPNPAKDKVTVTLSQNILNTLKVSLVDIHGKTIDMPKKTFNNTVEIDVSSLNAGLYFIQLSSGNNLIIEKLVVN